jgi:hypothetical protein
MGKIELVVIGVEVGLEFGEELKASRGLESTGRRGMGLARE